MMKNSLEMLLRTGEKLPGNKEASSNLSKLAVISILEYCFTSEFTLLLVRMGGFQWTRGESSNAQDISHAQPAPSTSGRGSSSTYSYRGGGRGEGHHARGRGDLGRFTSGRHAYNSSSSPSSLPHRKPSSHKWINPNQQPSVSIEANAVVTEPPSIPPSNPSHGFERQRPNKLQLVQKKPTDAPLASAASSAPPPPKLPPLTSAHPKPPPLKPLTLTSAPQMAPKAPKTLSRTQLVRIHGRMYSILKPVAGPASNPPRAVNRAITSTSLPQKLKVVKQIRKNQQRKISTVKRGIGRRVDQKKQWVRGQDPPLHPPLRTPTLIKSNFSYTRPGLSLNLKPSPGSNASKNVARASMLRAKALMKVRGMKSPAALNKTLRPLSSLATKGNKGPQRALATKGPSKINGTVLSLSLAQMKRKAVWSKQRADVNGPCLVFCRTGRCEGRDNGLCKREHDPNKVAVCLAFVQKGSCPGALVDLSSSTSQLMKPSSSTLGGSDVSRPRPRPEKRCLLQHHIIPRLLPLCSFFEREASCTNPSCPYPHIRHGLSVPICEDYQRGHCPLGTLNCPKRHVVSEVKKLKRKKLRSP